MLFLMLLFVVDCRIWTVHKVNYVFVFEFDTRHHLDWRQLAEVSSACANAILFSDQLTVALLFSATPWTLCMAELLEIWRRGDVHLLSCRSRLHHRVSPLFPGTHTFSSKSELVHSLACEYLISPRCPKKAELVIINCIPPLDGSKLRHKSC